MTNANLLNSSRLLRFSGKKIHVYSSRWRRDDEEIIVEDRNIEANFLAGPICPLHPVSNHSDKERPLTFWSFCQMHCPRFPRTRHTSFASWPGLTSVYCGISSNCWMPRQTASNNTEEQMKPHVVIIRVILGRLLKLRARLRRALCPLFFTLFRSRVIAPLINRRNVRLSYFYDCLRRGKVDDRKKRGNKTRKKISFFQI